MLSLEYRTIDGETTEEPDRAGYRATLEQDTELGAGNGEPPGALWQKRGCLPKEEMARRERPTTVA